MPHLPHHWGNVLLVHQWVNEALVKGSMYITGLSQWMKRALGAVTNKGARQAILSLGNL